MFCAETEASITCETVEAINARIRDSHQQVGGINRALCIVHHQKSMDLPRRTLASAIPDDVILLGKRYGMALVTTPDLRMLIQGILDYNWNRDFVKQHLLRPGRNGIDPPVHIRLGCTSRFNPKLSVISVAIEPEKVLRLNDTIGIRLPNMFVYEQNVTSMQVGGEATSTAVGPCNVGITTELGRSEARSGQMVNLRTDQPK